MAAADWDVNGLSVAKQTARQRVAWFVARYGEPYRLLACYAAMPLVLTPELLNYLHNRFLAGRAIPWVAEVDLLLSDLVRPVGYELYAMPPAVRDYLLGELRARAGTGELQAVARVLIHYIRHLARTNPYLDDEELRTQQWAAMVFLDETRAGAAQEIAAAFHAAGAELAARPAAGPFDMQRAEFARLAYITRMLAPELKQHRGLVEYAALVTRQMAGEAVESGAVQVGDVELRVPERLRPPPEPTQTGGVIDVTVHIALAPDGLYAVEIQALGEHSAFSRAFDAPVAAKRAMSLQDDPYERNARGLQVQGQELYELLVAGDDGALLERARSVGATQEGVSLRLQIDPPELAALPWEALHDGRSFLALGDNFTVTRTLPLSRPPRPLEADRPLRIVAAAANLPDANAPFDQAAARAEMMQALAPLRAAGLAEINWLGNATVDEIIAALQESADIFYFSGHGAFEPERGGGLLLFADEAGHAQALGAGDLVPLLAKQMDLRLAILNTDLSARGDATAPALAAALVQAGLPAAIGMQGMISDTGAIRFAQRLFDALGRGQTVGAAVQAGRRELAQAEPEGVEWVLPVLYTAAPDEVLIAAPVPEREVQTPPIVFDWVEIPAGPFLMGSDKRKDDQAVSDELPQHTVTLPAYRMARVPVTNEQYLAFVQGYTGRIRMPSHWDLVDGSPERRARSRTSGRLRDPLPMPSPSANGPAK